MQNYQKFLSENPNGTLATVDGGAAKTRIFQLLWTEGDKAYFCTSNQKPVFAQMKANSNVSFCTWDSSTFEVVSINGKVVFVVDLAKKTRALDENPGIKGIYKEPSNPVFEIFYIDISDVETFSYAEGSHKIKIK